MMKLNAEALLVLIGDLHALNTAQAARIAELESSVQQLSQALVAQHEPPTAPAAN